MSQKRILYISQEITPYLDETPMGIFSRWLPQRIQENGSDVRIFMPRYGLINERRHQLHEVIRLSGINIIVNDTDYPLIIKVASVPQSRIQVYFIDNDEFFKRKSLFGIEEKYGNDTADRSIFFVHGVFEAIKKLRWIPDVIHCVGWFGALAPAYLRTIYKDDPCFNKAKIVYSPFEQEEEGELDEKLMDALRFDGIDNDLVTPMGGACTPEALRRMAVAHCDGIIMPGTPSQTNLLEYAQQCGKPILEYPGNLKENVQKFQDFYDSLLD